MKTVLVLLSLALSTGCTHLAGVAPTTDAGAAADADADADAARRVYEWSRTDRNDTVRQYTRTTIVDDERACADIRTRRNFYSELGELEKRVVERRRCGYVEMRYVERYDHDGDVRVREVYLDKDHNGRFERRTVREEPILGRGALNAGLQAP
jgi:hypothetical protein